MVFSKTILLWLSASIFSEQLPWRLSIMPIEPSLADTNSFKSSGATNKGQFELHSFSVENGQILVIILIPPKLELVARH